MFAGTIIVDKRGRQIVYTPESSQLCRNCTDAFDETRANARLIAAAPELLDKLKSALPLIDDAFQKAKREFDDAPHVAESFRLQSEAVRAAIAKAEGLEILSG